MFIFAPQSPPQPHAGRVPARALTSLVKNSILAMSMRISSGIRTRFAVSGQQSKHHKRIGGRTTTTVNSVQELQLTRHTPHHA